MHLTLTRHWVDTDGMMSVYVAFERGDGYAAVQDVYMYPGTLAEFGRKLQAFPLTVADEIMFQAGSLDEDGYSGLKLRAYVYDGSGHTALQFSTWGNPAPQLRASINISALVEAASLNRLGEQIEAWADNNDEPLEFKSGRAS